MFLKTKIPGIKNTNAFPNVLPSCAPVKEHLKIGLIQRTDVVCCIGISSRRYPHLPHSSTSPISLSYPPQQYVHSDDRHPLHSHRQALLLKISLHPWLLCYFPGIHAIFYQDTYTLNSEQDGTYESSIKLKTVDMCKKVQQ